MTQLELVIMTLVSIAAYRSASSLFGGMANRESARLAVTMMQIPGGIVFLKLYVILGLPLAFLNGYLLRFSTTDCLIVGVGTWIGSLAATFLMRPVAYISSLFIFAGLTMIWLAVDVVRLFI